MTHFGTQGKKFPALFFSAALALGAGYVGGCAHHHHHDDVDAEIVVRDDHGWDHHGYYDHHGDWHGYYFDDRHMRHDDDPHWGREHDSDWNHRGHWD